MEMRRIDDICGVTIQHANQFHWIINWNFLESNGLCNAAETRAFHRQQQRICWGAEV
jgi:hypothetical protein